MTNNKFRRQYEFLVCGREFRHIFHLIGKGFAKLGIAIWHIIKNIPSYWVKFWKQIDRWLARPFRWFVKVTTKVQPNKIFFFTQEFRYGCNPKYICEELLKRNYDVDIVWRYDELIKNGLPSEVRKVQAGTYDYYKELFSSSVIVANSYIYLDQPLTLKKNQTLIQTWHGSLGIKKFGKKEMKGNFRRTRASVRTGKMTDYCITNSTFVSSSLRNTYWKNKPMLEYGHPRNDIFFDGYKEKREEIRHSFLKKYNLSSDVKFVLYAPTFRDSGEFDCYNIDFDRLITTIEARFGGTWVLLLRYHPSLLMKYQENEENNALLKNITTKYIDVTDYVDMQELISISDIGITDYSSWIYDFVLKRKPGFIFATDIAEYNTERGFCYPLETTPFPIAKDNDKLLKNIITFHNKRYVERVEKFLEEKGCVEDGHASERVVDFIQKLMNLQKKPDVEEEPKVAVPDVVNLCCYIRGKEKTDGREVYGDELRLFDFGGVHRGDIFLKEGDEIYFSLYEKQPGVFIYKDSFGYSNLESESRKLFDEVKDNKMKVLKTGTYNFMYSVKLGILSATYSDKSEPQYDFYLSGGFDKDRSQNPIESKYYMMSNLQDSYSLIQRVFFKKNAQFFILGVPSGSVDYKHSFAINGYHLIENDCAVKDNNNSMKVLEAGYYDVVLNRYSNTVTVTRTKSE